MAVTRCVMLLVFLFLGACREDERVQAYAALMSLSEEERCARLAAMPPEQQVELYTWALRYFRPQDLRLAPALAKQGTAVAPAIVKELERPESAAITSPLLLVLRGMVVDHGVNEARVSGEQAKGWCDRFHKADSYCHKLAAEIASPAVSEQR